MNPEILIVLSILLITVILFILEVFRIDVTAVLCMLALGWTGVLTPSEALSGFSSNAVIAMIAVMIMGKGISRTGIMDRLSRRIVEIVGKSRRRLLSAISMAVGVTSAFMQNVGAAALFLPAVLNISKREKISASSLVMPLGFAAILGGTLTMVASGPLILLNDLLKDAGLEGYGLFAVTPAGLVLLVTGILYFSVFGRFLFPAKPGDEGYLSEQKKLIDSWNLPYQVLHFFIPEASPLSGKTPEQSGAWNKYKLNILAVTDEAETDYAPWRNTLFKAGHLIAVLGDENDAKRFADDYMLEPREKVGSLDDLSDPGRAGFAELVIPPRSQLIGSSIRQFHLRKKYDVEPVMFFSGGDEIRGDFSDRVIKPGDTLVVYGRWLNILDCKLSRDFVVVTPFEAEKKEKSKVWAAVLCFLGGIALAVAGYSLSFSLLSGAAAMVVLGVIDIESAYRAVEWKVVFLIAGLIPLGIAMEKTGAAAFIADHIMSAVKGNHPLVLLTSIALLSTLFSLFMSNVASTVVLAPLVINMARIGGLDPRPLVLLVAVCAANSFLLPTHQVNAMLMTPGGYRNSDYFRAGGGMTLVFIVVAVSVFYLFYI